MSSLLSNWINTETMILWCPWCKTKNALGSQILWVFTDQSVSKMICASSSKVGFSGALTPQDSHRSIGRRTLWSPNHTKDVVATLLTFSPCVHTRGRIQLPTNPDKTAQCCSSAFRVIHTDLHCLGCSTPPDTTYQVEEHITTDLKQTLLTGIFQHLVVSVLLLKSVPFSSWCWNINGISPHIGHIPWGRTFPHHPSKKTKHWLWINKRNKLVS